MLDTKFWLAAAERAIKTFAQTMVALIGTEMVGIAALDWTQILSVSATATVLSLLTSVGSANLGSNPGPSLVDESTHPETVVVEVAAPVAKKATAAKKTAAAKKATTPKK